MLKMINCRTFLFQRRKTNRLLVTILAFCFICRLFYQEEVPFMLQQYSHVFTTSTYTPNSASLRSNHFNTDLNQSQFMDHAQDLDTAPNLNYSQLELYLDVDQSPPRDPVKDLQETMPNLPYRYWHKKNINIKLNNTCGIYPSLYHIKFNNGRWQTFDTSNGTFRLFNAYYDNRTLVEQPTVRILAMLNRIEPQLQTFCQLWFVERKIPFFAKVSHYNYIWTKAYGNYKQGIMQPYLLSCPLPKEVSHLVPESVSLVEKPCDKATTNLRVFNDRSLQNHKKDFAVCVKGLDIPHEDKSVYLVEWLEALYLLGADKVFMYDLNAHPNVTKVLNYYHKMGFVDLTKLTLPGDQPTTADLVHKYLRDMVGHKRLNELIPYNDCLYRNIYNYNYVVLLDIDELIVPKNTSSWKSLMELVVGKALNFKKRPRVSFYTRNVYFMDSMQEEHGFYQDIPRYMHILQHVYRAKNYTGPGAYTKCFHDTQQVLTLHNHFPFSCLGKGCTSYSISPQDAHLQHYRKTCVQELRKRCENDFKVYTVLDTSMWRYKKDLIERTHKTLSQLGFFRPHHN